MRFENNILQDVFWANNETANAMNANRTTAWQKHQTLQQIRGHYMTKQLYLRDKLKEKLGIDWCDSFISLRRRKLSMDDWKILADALCTSSSLKHLRLECHKLRVYGCQALEKIIGNNQSLTSLVLQVGSCPREEPFRHLAAAIGRNSHIIHLKLGFGRNHSDHVYEIIAGAMAENSTLENLDISNNTISEEGVKALGRALSVNTSITTLNLKGVNTSFSGWTLLMNGLVSGRKMKHLSLYDLPDQDCAYLEVEDVTLKLLFSTSVAACGALARALSTNASVTSMAFRMWSSNWTSSLGWKLLVQGLAASQSLKTLVSNKMVHLLDDHLFCVANVLAANNSLNHVSLSQSTISKKGCSALARALSTNKSLTSLELEGVIADSEGWELLVKNGLAANKSIQHLRLPNFSQWSCLAKMLAVNDSLTKIQVRDADQTLDANAAMAIAKGLVANYTLLDLTIEGPNNSSKERECMEGFLLLNRAGRRRLVMGYREHGTTTVGHGVVVGNEDWMNALIQCHKNTPALFYLLSAKPDLCTIH